MEQLQMDHDLIIYHGHLTKFCVLRPVKSKWISYRSCTADGYFPPFRQYFITTTALPEFTAHIISNIKLFACFGHGSWQSSSSAKSWICWTNKWWRKRYVQWWTSGTYGAVFGSRWRMVPGKNEKEKKHHSARTLPYCSCSYNKCLVGEPVHLLPHWQPFSGQTDIPAQAHYILDTIGWFSHACISTSCFRHTIFQARTMS